MERNNISILLLLLLMAYSLTACSQAGSNDQTSKIKDLKIMKDTFEINKSDETWKKELTPEQYYVLREKGTERPYTGKFLMHKENGMYTCGACGNPLFASDSKFDSHCGWPSFDKEVEAGRVVTKEDNTHGMRRTEILCGRCGGHLGHVFDDGPTETGLRYCVNSLSLGFEPENEKPLSTNDTAQYMDTLTLGGGCFWCVEAVYARLEGVVKVESGYSGGDATDATYNQVSSGRTKHAEVIQVVYDTRKVSLEDVLKVFFTVHDPTTLNRQGADVGPQYRSVIFYRGAEQKAKAEAIIAAITAEHIYKNPVVTQVVPFEAFYKAEDYHQDYFANNKNQGYCQMVIVPKIEKFEKIFKDKIKK